MVMRGLAVPWARRLYIMKDCKREAIRAGVPTFRLGDLVTWGQDRFWLLEQELQRLLRDA